MSMNGPQPKKVTYAEYLAWDAEPRFEIIDGIPMRELSLCFQEIISNTIKHEHVGRV